MTLQEQLRKLTTGGPGVTHIATETLFEDCAKELDFYAHAIESWKREEAEWITENSSLKLRLEAIKSVLDKVLCKLESFDGLIGWDEQDQSVIDEGRAALTAKQDGTTVDREGKSP